MATRREKEQREERYASAKDRAEKHGRESDSTALNIPKGVKLFTKFKKAGIYRLDILPYRVVTPGNPFCDCDPQNPLSHYERTYYLHWIPTAQGPRPYVCLAKSLKKKCPICAYVSRALRDGTIDQETADKMGEVKERQLFNIIDLDDPNAGVQIMEFNHWQLGRLIDSKMKKDRYSQFYSRKGGYTLEVETEEGVFNKKTTYPPIGISFEPRGDYDEDIYDKVHDLDTIPKIMSYEDLEKILLEGGEAEEPKPAPKPSTNGTSKSRGEGAHPSSQYKEEDDDDDDDDDGVPEDENGDDPTAEDLGIEKGVKVIYRKKEWKVKKVSGDGISLTLEDDEGEEERGVAPGDVKLLKEEEDDEDELEEDEGYEDEEDDTPPKKGTKKAPVKNEDEEEDELDEDELEEDEDEEEEKPAPKKKRGS